MKYTRTISFRSNKEIDDAIKYIKEKIQNDLPINELTDSNVIKSCISYVEMKWKREEQMYNK